ncbi:MAG: hypothetical protein ACLRG1_02805 [Streptococcus salivarius]
MRTADLTKDTPTKEATQSPSRCWYLLTVVGETREKKTLIHWSMEQMVSTRYRQNFANLLNVQFANKVVETVQKVVSSKSKQTSMS